MQTLEPVKTTFLEAISALIDKIEKSIEGYPFDIKMTLVGGAAMHLYCGSRYTEDVDAFFSKKILFPEDVSVYYKKDDGNTCMLYLDKQYNPTFGLLHEDAEDDALYCKEVDSEKRKIKLYVLSPVDLAVSKISRYGTQDVEDIEELARHGLIDADSLNARANEALLDYVGNHKVIRHSIALITEKVRAIEVAKKNEVNNLGCEP